MQKNNFPYKLEYKTYISNCKGMPWSLIQDITENSNIGLHGIRDARELN